MKANRPKLQMLKPRLATLSTDKFKTLGTGARAKGEGSTARGYGYKWRKARERYLSEHPLCCYCEREGGVVTAATVVDHIIPHKGDQALFWDESNWQSLCDFHHNSAKAREEGRGR